MEEELNHLRKKLRKIDENIVVKIFVMIENFWSRRHKIIDRKNSGTISISKRKMFGPACWSEGIDIEHVGLFIKATC